MKPRVYISKIITKKGETVKTNLTKEEVGFYRKLLENFDSNFNYKKDSPSPLSLDIWLSQKVNSTGELLKIFKEKGIMFGDEIKQQKGYSSKTYGKGCLKIGDDRYLIIHRPELDTASIKINIKTGGRFIGRELTDKMKLDIVGEQLTLIKKCPGLVEYLELRDCLIKGFE